jgi:hypothetical protein
MMSRHPADETLAEFADGKLNGRARRTMIEHLASCDDCRSIYDVIADAQDADVIDRYAPIPGNFGKVAISTLAVAAAATIVFFTPPVQERVAAWRTGGVSRLVSASEGLDKRPVAGRLAGFPHSPFDTPRGDEKAEFAKMILQGTAASVIEESDGESVKELRAKGLGHLLLGERDEAVNALELASKAAGGNDPLILSDLAAAYLERARFPGGKPMDLASARETADRAWKMKKTPETAWNRAHILEYANDPGANAAWNAYLELDSTSPWAQEVREKHLDREL